MRDVLVSIAFTIFIGVICVLVLIGAFMNFSLDVKEIQEAENERYQNAIEAGYTCYLDGEEVDPITLNKDEYTLTYNDELHVLYFTKIERYNSSTRFVWVPNPPTY